jgi:hypothetical protein
MSAPCVETVVLSTERATAIHEAGHAVVARVVGIDVPSATVESDEKAEGCCSCSVPVEWFEPDVYAYNRGAGRTHCRIDQGIMFCLAGSLAEERMDEDVDGLARGTRHDYHLAVMLASYAMDDPHETHAFLDWLGIRTRNVLCQPKWWAAVEGLADRLLIERTMSGRHCRQAIQVTIDDHSAPGRARILTLM